MTRALVTGGAGFIGSNLVDAILARGDSVAVIDDLSTGRKENLTSALESGAELTQGDVTDPEFVAGLVGDFKPEAVFHLAAQIDVRRSVRDPGFDASVNVLGTIAVLEAVRAAGGAPVVFASTGGAIYGEGSGRELPLREDASRRPDAPYGQSKLAAEGYVGYYRRVHGLPAVSLRLGNVYGPRQDPLGEAGVIAIFSGRVTDGTRPTVYGDGRQTRDYVYVADVVDAFLAAERQLSAANAGLADTYNIGTGRETAVLELVERLARIADRPEFEPEMAPAREGEVQRISLDAGAAAAELDWHARTDLDEGLERTLASVDETVRRA